MRNVFTMIFFVLLLFFSISINATTNSFKINNETVSDKNQIKNIELSLCTPILEKRAVIFRSCYFYKNVGFEPSYAIDSYGDYVISGNFVLSSDINSDTWKTIIFGTIGYGKFLPYGSGMINLGCGIKYRFSRSFGIRSEFLLFVGEDGAGYFGPSIGISYFLKL